MARRKFGRRKRAGGGRRRRGGHRRRGGRGRRHAVSVGNTAGLTPQNLFPYGVASSLLP